MKSGGQATGGKAMAIWSQVDVSEAKSVPVNPLATRRTSRVTRAIVGYLFVLPFLVLFFGLVAYPIGYGFYISLHHWNPIVGDTGFAGLSTYALLLFHWGSLQSQQFWQGMGNTVLFVVISVPFLVFIPLVIAYGIYRARGRSLFRPLYFFPATLSATAVTSIWAWILQTQGGAVNQYLGVHIPWLVAQPWAWISIDLVTIWWTSGFNMVILYAGISQLPQSVFDAAHIDGAGTLSTFFSIAVPQIRPVLVFVGIISTIASFNLFAQPYLMTGGGPGFSTSPITMFIYGEGFNDLHMGTATAMAFLMGIVLAGISLGQYWISKGGNR
jgi:multiple sugar transport system permease protein